MKIVYLGLKEQKSDNVAQTGLIWQRGQVLEVVDPKKAAKLLEYPQVWADADKPYQLAEPLQVVSTGIEPRVEIVPQGGTQAGAYWEPIRIPVPEEVWGRLQAKEFEAVFMTPADAEAFSIWKKARDEALVKATKKRDREAA